MAKNSRSTTRNTAAVRKQDSAPAREEPKKQYPNLATPVQPGEIRNPKGRGDAPIGVRARLKAILKKKAPEECLALLRAMGIEPDGNDVAAAISGHLAGRAANGDLDAIKEVVKQTEHPLQKNIGIGGLSGGPVRFVTPENMDETEDEEGADE